MNFVTSKTIKEKFGITDQTLYNWRKREKIKYKIINSKLFLYDIDSICQNINNRINVIYVRVSNTKQKEDLFNQENIIKHYCLHNGIKIDYVYSDIASGMNENRKSFNQLIIDVIDKKINKIYITYEDRLTRFGFSYFKKMFEYFNTEIEILNAATNKTFEEEMVSDLISIIHHFSMKMYSNRRKQLTEIKNNLRKDLLIENNQVTNSK